MDRQGTATSLGHFLRACRERVRPADVGLVDDGRPRRVPGLRREELAQLANVSVDYIMRLEQGRTTTASRGILLALADALRLEREARDYLLTVAETTRRPPAGKPAPRRVTQVTQQLLDDMAYLPALVLGRSLDVLAWNDTAAAMFTDFAALPPEHRNMVRLVFLDPAFRALYENWEHVARECVAYLRRDAGNYPDDSSLAALVGELSLRDNDFRSWWASHLVRAAGLRTKTFQHSEVGKMTLTSQRYGIDGQPDQYLIVYTAEPGSASDDSLRLLRTWQAGDTSGLSRLP